MNCSIKSCAAICKCVLKSSRYKTLADTFISSKKLAWFPLTKNGLCRAKHAFYFSTNPLNIVRSYLSDGTDSVGDPCVNASLACYRQCQSIRYELRGFHDMIAWIPRWFLAENHPPKFSVQEKKKAGHDHRREMGVSQKI